MADAEAEDFVGLFSPLGHLSKRTCRVNGEGEAPAVVCSEVSYRMVLQGLDRLSGFSLKGWQNSAQGKLAPASAALGSQGRAGLRPE